MPGSGRRAVSSGSWAQATEVDTGRRIAVVGGDNPTMARLASALSSPRIVAAPVDLPGWAEAARHFDGAVFCSINETFVARSLQAVDAFLASLTPDADAVVVTDNRDIRDRALRAGAASLYVSGSDQGAVVGQLHEWFGGSRGSVVERKELLATLDAELTRRLGEDRPLLRLRMAGRLDGLVAGLADHLLSEVRRAEATGGSWDSITTINEVSNTASLPQPILPRHRSSTPPFLRPHASRPPSAGRGLAPWMKMLLAALVILAAAGLLGWLVGSTFVGPTLGG